MRSYEPKVYNTFLLECKQQIDLKTYIAYSGGHAQGDRSGFGCELTVPQHPFTQGDFYCGNWVKGLRHGSGICYYANGSVYKGSWSEGQWGGGNGIFKNENGEILLGVFTEENGKLKDL